MQIGNFAVGVGFIIALVVLVVAIILLIADEYSREWVLGLIAALAVARMVP